MNNPKIIVNERQPIIAPYILNGGPGSGRHSEGGHHPAVVSALKRILARPIGAMGSLRDHSRLDHLEGIGKDEYFNDDKLRSATKSFKDAGTKIRSAFEAGEHLK
jgi:hypothetical protein